MIDLANGSVLIGRGQNLKTTIAMGEYYPFFQLINDPAAFIARSYTATSSEADLLN